MRSAVPSLHGVESVQQVRRQGTVTLDARQADLCPWDAIKGASCRDGAYVAKLVKAGVVIREVWLVGSRGNGLANESSGWDHLVFAGKLSLEDF